MTLDSWTAFQKFLFISEQTEFGIYIKQLKKLPHNIQQEMVDGFSNGQVESKLWLLESLRDVLPLSHFEVKVLGSWFGLLPRMLLWSFGNRIKAVRAYDIDPRWEAIAKSLNEPETYSSRCQFFTKDMNEIDYGAPKILTSTIVINTSCEHLENFDTWFQRLVPGNLVVLQGNNFAEPAEHHTLWSSLKEFKKSAPLQTILYEGQLKLAKYDRYMLIGVR
jgi:hypothetical protein